MKIVQFSRFGPPEQVAECIEADDPPAPAADEVTLDVLAFPINPADTLMIEGRYAVRPPLPSRAGAECIARVAAIGSAVTDLKAGDLVIPLDRDNWVQRKLAKADRVMKVPAGVDPLQLAMLKVNPPTAYLMMTKYVALSPGDWILQTAANSGVGHCLIQLAKAEGFKTVNIVRREGLADELTALGADVVLVDGPDLAAAHHRGYQGRAHQARHRRRRRHADRALRRRARRRGHRRQLRPAVGREPAAERASMRVQADSASPASGWCRGCRRCRVRRSPTLYGGLAKHVADGSLRVPIQATFPIEEIKQALALANGYHRAGKVLVTPNGPVG